VSATRPHLKALVVRALWHYLLPLTALGTAFVALFGVPGLILAVATGASPWWLLVVPPLGAVGLICADWINGAPAQQRWGVDLRLAPETDEVDEEVEA
jgi:hypothetical protein